MVVKMKLELLIYGHDDFEPTGIILNAINYPHAIYQAKWIYPALKKHAFNFKELN